MSEDVRSGQPLSEALQRVQSVLLTRTIYSAWPADERRMQTQYEAQTLLLTATGRTRTQLLTANTEDQLTAQEAAWLNQAVQARLTGMPLGYITNVVAFYGHDLFVQPGCLIPRPETEILVAEAIRWLQQHPTAKHVYDLGCGSGAIAISVALDCPQAIVEAIDVSPAALAIAEENGERLQAAVAFVLEDGLLDLAHRATGPSTPGATAPLIHLLVSNPPYIPTADILTLEMDVRAFEPRIALDGGLDGLDFYRALFAIGDAFFVATEPAALFLEVGIHQAQLLLAELATGEYPGWVDWTFKAITDLRGVPRILVGERTRR